MNSDFNPISALRVIADYGMIGQRGLLMLHHVRELFAATASVSVLERWTDTSTTQRFPSNNAMTGAVADLARINRMATKRNTPHKASIIEAVQAAYVEVCQLAQRAGVPGLCGEMMQAFDVVMKAEKPVAFAPIDHREQPEEPSGHFTYSRGCPGWSGID